MNIDETAELLSLAALTDRRDVDEAVLSWWHEMLAETDFTDARTVLKKHYQTSTEYLMPVHIVKGVRDLEEERLRLFGDIGFSREIGERADLTEDQKATAEVRWKQERAKLVRRGLLVKHPSTREVLVVDGSAKAVGR